MVRETPGHLTLRYERRRTPFRDFRQARELKNQELAGSPSQILHSEKETILTGKPSPDSIPAGK